MSLVSPRLAIFHEPISPDLVKSDVVEAIVDNYEEVEENVEADDRHEHDTICEMEVER